MAADMILRLIVIGAGIVLLMMDFYAFARRRMNETIGLGWGLFGIILILISAITPLAGWSRILSGIDCIAIFVILIFMLFGIFGLSVNISKLLMKNQELAMQVSLLNQENEQILKELESLTGKSKVTL